MPFLEVQRCPLKFGTLVPVLKTFQGLRRAILQHARPRTQSYIMHSQQARRCALVIAADMRYALISGDCNDLSPVSVSRLFSSVFFSVY